MMPGYKDVLAAEEYSAGKAADVEFLLQSRAYQDYYAPMLQNMMQRFLTELADPALARHWKANDDYLRGGIAVARMLLNAPYAMLEDYRQERENEAEETREQARLERIAQEGHGPMGSDGPIPA